MAANQRQLLSVERPVEVENVLGGEIRNLFALGTIERLQPQIVDAIFAHWDKLPPLPSREKCSRPERGRSNSSSFAALLPSVSTTASISLCSPECSSVGNAASLPSGETSKSPRDRRLGDDLRDSAVDRHFGQVLSAARSLKNTHLPSCEHTGFIVQLPVRNLLEIAPRRIHAPDVLRSALKSYEDDGCRPSPQAEGVAAYRLTRDDRLIARLPDRSDSARSTDRKSTGSAASR